MTDLLDFLGQNDNGYTRYSPSSNGESFTNASDLLEGSSSNIDDLIDPITSSHFYIIGSQADDKTISLDSYDVDCAAKLPFMSKHGTIGENGVFPSIGTYPKVPNGMDEAKKAECFGSDWEKTAENDEDTFLTIGATASWWDKASTDISPVCNAKILVKEIATTTNQVSFPNIIQLESESVSLHADQDVAIEITEQKVIIYEPSEKRNLNIYPCSSDFKLKSKSSTPAGEVWYADSTADCIIDVISNTLDHDYNPGDFTYLIEKE